jgi:PAS domain S-box-containing protein
LSVPLNLLVRFPLRVMIPLSLIVFSGLIIALMSVHNLARVDREVEHRTRQQLVQLMTRSQGTVRNLSRKRDADGIQLEISQLGSDPLVQMAALIDEHNLVRHATQYALINKNLLDVLPEVGRAPIEDARRRRVGSVQLRPDRDAYLAYYPVELWNEDTALAGVRLGMLVAQYDVATIRRQAHGLVVEQLFQFSLVIISFSLVLWLTFHYGLTRRVHRLVESARRLGEGDFDARAGLSGRDELAQVGRAFDDMARLIAEDQCRLEENEARVRAILDNMADGSVTTNDQGMIQSINPALSGMLHYSAKDVVGRHLSVLFAGGFHRIQDEYLARKRLTADPGQSKVQEVVGMTRERCELPLEVTVADFRLAEERLFVWIMRDITERKRVDRLKNEFVSIVSHELRTPLTSIMGSLGLLTAGVTGGLSEQSRQLIDIARNNSERLVRLINDILDIEKIESGKMHFRQEILDLNELVEQAIDANRGYAARYSVQFLLEQPLPDAQVRGDADRLLQVLSNLLSNAAKYSPQDRAVRIRLSRHGADIRVEVSDEGPGIPQEFHDRIFEKFAQADSTDTRTQDGTGLGLCIAKSIIDHHGGRIGFHSIPNVGTEFHFDLPEWRELHHQAV